MPDADPRPTRGRSRWGWWLVGMTFLVLGLGLLLLAYPLYRQQQIVTQLRARGGVVEKFPYFEDVWPTWLKKWTDELIVQGVYINFPQRETIDDVDGQLVSELLALTYNDTNHPPSSELGLDHTRLTEVGWSRLSGARSLRHVRVVSQRITDSNLAALENLPLSSLVLSDAAVTDAGVAKIKSIASLKYLDLTGSLITDAALEHLATLTALDELYLDDTRVSAKGLPHLLKLKDLRVLRLAGTDIDDAGVPTLMRFTTLKTLALDRTRVTSKGFAAVQAALPNTEVTW